MQKHLVKIAETVIKNKEQDSKEKFVLIDERLLKTPSFAILVVAACNLLLKHFLPFNLLNSTTKRRKMSNVKK